MGAANALTYKPSWITLFLRLTVTRMTPPYCPHSGSQAKAKAFDGENPKREVLAGTASWS